MADANWLKLISACFGYCYFDLMSAFLADSMRSMPRRVAKHGYFEMAAAT